MGYGTVNTGYPSKGGGFIEMEESLAVSERKDNMLYGLILVDFDAEGEVNADVDA